jgi:hypothetical protein
MFTFKQLTSDLRSGAQLSRAADGVKSAFPRRELVAFRPLDVALHEEAAQSDLDEDPVLVGLKLAAALEFATVPPYLLALWSVIDEQHPVARSIRAIVHEEMVHMALVNNVLSAIGGTPTLTALGVPTYPSQLPGGVHPEITLALLGLCDKSLDSFLEIERPTKVVTIQGYNAAGIDDDTTVRDFYEALLDRLREAPRSFEGENQVVGPLAPLVISKLDDVQEAFERIITEGEGSPGTPFDEDPDDLSHYYRFLEIKLGCKLAWDADDRILRRGDPIPVPSVYPVASPPTHGWGRASSRRVRDLSKRFNVLYSSLLDQLQSAWAPLGHRSFLKSMELMFEMREVARSLIREPGPGGFGHAPEFRYINQEQRR